MDAEAQQQLPNLTTQETQRLRSDYPSIEHLEAGNVAAWLVERQEQLLVRAKDERTGMNLAKLLTITGSVVGAVCYATSPLAPIGALIAGVGYIWAVAQDINDSHQFAPIPFVRGNFIDFLSAMGDKDARDEWFADQNELVDLMFHLAPLERYEFAMLKEHAHVLSEYLVKVEPGKRFYAYRWLSDWFVSLKGTFPRVEQLTSHLATVTPDPRINYQQVKALQEHLEHIAIPQGIPPTQIAELPTPKTAELPRAIVGETTKLEAIETQIVEEKSPEVTLFVGAIPTSSGQLPTVDDLSRLPMKERAIAILNQLSADGFDLSRCIADQITCICGNQRGGKGTLMAILAILASAIDPTTKIHYFTAGDDIYPFTCNRLVCRLSYPDLDGDKADFQVAQQLYNYLKEMDKLTQGACQDIILVIDEAVALSDYLDPEQKQWMIRFLLTRANKKGAQIFIVLHGKSLTSWVGNGNTSGFSQTFKTGATFIGCEATSKKINPLRSISVATGRYYLAEPDDFSKAVEGGNLGIVPQWVKTEINPATGQPDPARTLLTFFPELNSELPVVNVQPDKPIDDSHSAEKPQSNVTEIHPESQPDLEAQGGLWKVLAPEAEGSGKPDETRMEAFLAQIASTLQAEASSNLPPLFEGLDRDGKLLMLRLLLSQKLGKEKTILLAWGLKSGGRNHDKYRYASELLDAMIRELSGLGLDEENNWGVNHLNPKN